MDTLASSAVSLPGGSGESNTANLSAVFKQLRDSKGDLSAASVRTLVDVLNGETTVRENRANIGRTKHMLTLKWNLRKPTRQQALYATSGADEKEVRDLLRLVYGESVAHKNVTVSSLMQASVASETGSKFMGSSNADDGFSTDAPIRRRTAGKLSASEQREYRAVFNQIMQKYTRINAYVPYFLTGSYAMLAASKTLNESWTIMEMLFKASDFVCDTLAEEAPLSRVNAAGMKPSEDQKNWTFIDCAKAIVSLMSRLDTADNIDLFADAFDACNINDLTAAREFAAKCWKSADDDAATFEVTEDAELDDIPITKPFFDFLIDNDIPFPVDFFFTRPSMTYEVASAIMLKKGGETGASFYGEADFQLSNDGARKVLFGFFTVYCGAKVWQHENVFVFPFVHCRRYMGGGNMLIFDNNDMTQRDDYALGITKERSIFKKCGAKRIM